MIDIYSSAREMISAVANREISACELLTLHIDRINEKNRLVNAFTEINFAASLAMAEKADAWQAAGKPLGALHGLPYAVKDMANAAGWRTTLGLGCFRDNLVTSDDVIVARFRSAGAIVIGKSNVPELAADAHTGNIVFGVTSNPYDLARSAGGSSGGSAAALAAGFAPIADGSDMGGSIRTPASFCNVVGLRPTPGRIPIWPTSDPWAPLPVHGPMARTVGDVALLLDIASGYHTRTRMSLDRAPEAMAQLENTDLDGLRIGYTVDFGGAFDIDADVATVVLDAVATARKQRMVADAAFPSVNPVLLDSIYGTLRVFSRSRRLQDILDRIPDALTPELTRLLEESRRQPATAVADAYAGLVEVYDAVGDFFDTHDLFLCPVASSAAFVSPTPPHRWLGENAQLDWLRPTSFVTLFGCPAISVPFGFTDQGLPVGIQLVASPRNEGLLLAAARRFEQSTNAATRRPVL